ncbi:hypothetical protein Bca52824_033998 [Brassica carinata]|uniref:Uncharacterized protein n=1 Tax=Brassica carinata TaxID=52824 RepID=A0A8X7SFH3_BRACI|nr:hypothetical protein Bca52824_033998 [Brassica carinata]
MPSMATCSETSHIVETRFCLRERERERESFKLLIFLNNEVQKPSTVDPFNASVQVSEFQSPSRFAALGDLDMPLDEPPTFGLTRDGRETRPPLKFQNLEWKTAKGRRKHGCRGSGNTR